MATFAVTKNEVVLSTPFLIRKLTCTGGATSLAYDHGEDRAPDLILPVIVKETPTVTTVAAARTDADTLTLDTLGDAADDIEIYLVWFSQATAGLNPP